MNLLHGDISLGSIIKQFVLKASEKSFTCQLLEENSFLGIDLVRPAFFIKFSTFPLIESPNRPVLNKNNPLE